MIVFQRNGMPLRILQRKHQRNAVELMARFVFYGEIESQRGVFVGAIENRLHMKAPDMSFRHAEQPHLAEDPREREVGVVAHVVQMRGKSFPPYQDGQKVVPADMCRTCDVEFEGRESRS